MTLLLTSLAVGLNTNTFIDFVANLGSNNSITYDNCDLRLKHLLNIKSDIDLQILIAVIKKTSLRLTTEELMKHEGGNPVYLAYVEWETNWRLESVKSSYDWRIASENFSSVLNDAAVQQYLKELSLISCTLFDEEYERSKWDTY